MDATASYESVPDLAAMPMCPGAKVGRGWNPIRQKPIGAMIPGALAPTSLDLDCVFKMLATYYWDQWIFP